MEHGVAVDAVVLCVAASRSAHPSVEVALLTEQVAEVLGYDKGLALEECLGYLSVPNQFVGVGRWVVVSASAMFANIGADLEPCGKPEEHLPSIAELPSVEIIVGLQLVTSVLIVE